MYEKTISLCRQKILVASVCFVAHAAQAATFVVGTCRAGRSFTTIQAAVTAAPSGSTIDVCPGIYPEQVMIEAKTLTLVGVLSGTNDAAVLVPPAGGLIMNGTRIVHSDFGEDLFGHGANGVHLVGDEKKIVWVQVTRDAARK